VTLPAPLRDRYEIVVVGAGIAGASLAYFLVDRGFTDVLLLEREAAPGYHSTGRSAGVLVEYHREPRVRRLIHLAASFLREPPPGLVEDPLLDPVGVMIPSAGEAWRESQSFARTLAGEGVAIELLDREQTLARIPVLEPSAIEGSVLLTEGGHLDVHGLHSGYLRALARAGGELCCGCEVQGFLVERGRCVGLRLERRSIHARVVVDAAGAWAGELARHAGAAPIAISPRRRTVISFAPPAGLDPRRWPMVDSELHRYYFKPESGGLLASPMDQSPSEPCDARPGELEIAEAVDRLERFAPTLAPRTLRRSWAGLRSFAPDEVPLVGFDPLLEGFFWLAGQGGVGIETSPILGRLAAGLILDGASELDPSGALSPRRFGDALT
jgi:D-arginine dehydrogenase